MLRHNETTRAAYHDRVDGVSAGISTSHALATTVICICQCLNPIGGPACDRSSSDQEFTTSPDWGCIPKQPDLSISPCGPGTTRLSPSPAPPSSGLGPGPLLMTLLHTTIRSLGALNSQVGLFLVRSSLLGESL
ncbi:hypothetical protein GBA52_015188 [Prunus armeniaca]|nr:hypothetical protein GBA52_015188 [Prunus armeniaca]